MPESQNTPQLDFLGLPVDMTEGFWEFHRGNPHVYARLVEMTRLMTGAGRIRVGMSMLFEVLRWEHFMRTDSNEPFKLNNNYRAYYSRLIERDEPDLMGVFTKRQSVSDKELAA